MFMLRGVGRNRHGHFLGRDVLRRLAAHFRASHGAIRPESRTGLLHPTRGFAAACLALLICTHAHAGGSLTAPRLGIAIPEAEAQKWNLNVFPDGRGLPEGRGTAKEGRVIFEKQCESCHGPEGRGATAEELVGEPKPPSKEDPTKVIGSYWPYATTLFDFTRRSMPPQTAGLLTNDEVYAVTAYLLFANKIITETDEINATSLPKIKMPNRDGFVWIDAK